MNSFANKKVMDWNCQDVSDWIDTIANEKEFPHCGHLFFEKGIDGQRLWDFLKISKLSEINVPTMGLKLTLSKRIKHLIGDSYQ
jgi:hypothetical protein